ncbi:hypothetical protein ACHAXS_000273, partial [Conticribra weissflogii]
QVKSFLKEEGGVDLYKNVKVNFIHGRKAVLTIYRDGVETEKVTLSDYNDKMKLHELFVEKGFEKYSFAEVRERRMRLKREEEEKLKVRNNDSKMDRGFLRNARTNLKTKRELKEKIKQLKEARANYMMDASLVV